MTVGLRLAATVLTTVALAAACAGSGPERSAGAPPETTVPGPQAETSTSLAPPEAIGPGPDLNAVRLRLSKIDGLSGPLALAVRPDDDALYVAEKRGIVRRVVHGQTGEDVSVDPTPVLDLSGQVSTGGEQGLLGLTFSPNGGTLFVDYTDRAGDTQVVEYAFLDGIAGVATRRVVLSVDQPFANHNGGQVAFGPDGRLYIGLGDGGGANDPNRRGQDLRTLLAKILRIDPTPSGDKAYTVPPDNPFVGRADAAPETFAWGLRNPWRFTWDRETADLWIGDVGQNQWEEIDFRTAADAPGSNFGWSLLEANHRLHGDNPPGGVLPITEYDHDNGNCSVVGGYVYRGSRIPALQGAYLYGDTCSGKVWGLVQADGKAVDNRELNVGGTHQIYSFGEDASGELYLLAADGLYRIEAA